MEKAQFLHLEYQSVLIGANVPKDYTAAMFHKSVYMLLLMAKADKMCISEVLLVNEAGSLLFASVLSCVKVRDHLSFFSFPVKMAIKDN